MTLTSKPSFEILIDLAARMGDPERIRAFVIDPANSNPDPIFSSPTWHDLSLSNGYPSLVLLFSLLQHKGLIEEEMASLIIHRYILKIKEAIEDKKLHDLSLFSGVSGICYVIQLASKEGTRYQRILSTLNTFLVKNIKQAYLDPIKHNVQNSCASSSMLHDLILGLAGVGRYCLENLSIPQFSEISQQIIDTLIMLCKPQLINGKNVPGWFLCPNDHLNIIHRSRYPKGNFNLGLAHGVPGILVFLSIAALRGIILKNQRETMREIANWICNKSFKQNNILRWPYVVTWEEEVQEKPYWNEASKDAWCYGSPGISRALFLAGKALGDSSLKIFALNAFNDIFLLQPKEWQLQGPNLCHGISGLLMVTSAMSKEDPRLVEKVHQLEQLLLSFYNPDFPLGFKDHEPCKKAGWAEISKPGLLEGTSGILLTLLNLRDPDPRWYLPFLIYE